MYSYIVSVPVNMLLYHYTQSQLYPFVLQHRRKLKHARRVTPLTDSNLMSGSYIQILVGVVVVYIIG